MATTYIVEGHLGGMYLSQEDPEVIQEFCEQCGDCDWIVGEFDSEDSAENIADIATFCYVDYWVHLPMKEDVKDYPYTLPELEEMIETVEEAFSEDALRSWFNEMEFSKEVADAAIARREEYIANYSFIREAM